MTFRTPTSRISLRAVRPRSKEIECERFHRRTGRLRHVRPIRGPENSDLTLDTEGSPVEETVDALGTVRPDLGDVAEVG